MSINVIINGSGGKMGHILADMIETSKDMQVCAKISHFGEDGAMKNLSEFTGEADVLVDFSNHEGTAELVDYITERKMPAVIATTGQNEEELVMIDQAAKHVPIFKSANMSVGVALLRKLVREATEVFPYADIEIIEAHHNRKIDAPSGTAIMLADAVRDVRSDAEYNIGRGGHQKREKNEVGIQSIRMGNIVGEHEVIICTENQSITLKHSAYDRGLFAEGAISATRFIVGKEPGLYDMDDILG